MKKENLFNCSELLLEPDTTQEGEPGSAIILVLVSLTQRASWKSPTQPFRLPGDMLRAHLESSKKDKAQLKIHLSRPGLFVVRERHRCSF